jgi:RHS repeat-associated protein
VASQYDLSGNQTGDAPPGSGNTFTYDAENHQVTFNGTGGQYGYDGDGHRVTRSTSAGTTVFVYDVGGQLIAEYGGQTSTSNAGTSYLTTDHLGSTRVVTSSTGAVISRHDYLPFGEEIQISQSVTIAGRTTSQGYGGTDDTRQKFTSKERDTESGLDYFEARYFSSMQGRFTSPDEFTSGPEDVEDFTDIATDNSTLYADIHEPQSFNKYQYCYNNPLRHIDPNGHGPGDLAKSVWNWGKQTVSDTVIGGAKGVYNAAVSVPNTINSVINLVISPVTDSRLPTAQYAQPSTQGERGAMIAVDIIGVYYTAKGMSAPSATKVSAETAAEAPKASFEPVHGNSLESPNESHVYRIDNPQGLQKIGESGGGVRVRDGASIRAESQARALTRSTGQPHTTRIIGRFPKKAGAVNYQTRLIRRYRRMYGSRPPKNETDR